MNARAMARPMPAAPAVTSTRMPCAVMRLSVRATVAGRLRPTAPAGNRVPALEIARPVPTLPAPTLATSASTRPCGESNDDHHRDPFRDPRDARLPGRGQAAAAADDPLALQQQGDLPARAGLQRLRRLRQAALRGDRRAGAARRRPRLAIDVAFDKAARTITVSDNGVGMSRNEASNISAPSRTPARASSSPASPATRRRTRSSSASSASASTRASSSPTASRWSRAARRRRPTRRPLGERRAPASTPSSRRRARGAAPTSSCTCKPDQDELLSAWQLKRSSTQLLRPHRHPILMRKEEWDKDKGEIVERDELETVNQASALWARPKSEITDEQYKSSTSTSRTTAATRSPGRTTASRAAPSTPSCSTSRAGAVRPVGSRAPPRHQALREARLHHGRRRAAAARVPALRARRRRLRRPAAQRVARDPAGVARRRRDPRRVDQARARPARGPRREPPGQLRDVLEGVRAGAEGRHRRGRREPRAHREAAALRVHRQRGRADACRSPTTWRA